MRGACCIRDSLQGGTDCNFVAMDDRTDQLPLPSQVGKTKVGGVDINTVRIRNVLAAVLALGPAPTGFSVAQLAAKVQTMTGQPASAYSTRQAAYDLNLKKLRGKTLVTRLGASRRYQLQPPAMRAIAALLILRQHVIAHRIWDANPRHGPLPIVTTSNSASACNLSSKNSVSPHRQFLVVYGSRKPLAVKSRLLLPLS